MTNASQQDAPEEPWFTPITGEDILGFIEERCPHCGAHLFGREKRLCLNACMVPHWQVREANAFFNR